MIVFTATREYFNDGVQLDEMLISAIVFPLTGILMGVTTWWNMEGRYKTAQLEDDTKRRLNG